MKISAKTDYACRALLELALNWPNPTPLPIQVLSARQKIPMKFLTHILVELKKLGLVESSRGQKGGYCLVKTPREITLAEIASNFEAIWQTKRLRTRLKSTYFLDTVWQDVDHILYDHLKKFNFDDLSKKARELGNVPMYTI